MRKLTIEEVRKYFESQGCKLLETEYINSKIKMKYRCKCGNSKCKITFSNFKTGYRCMECGGSKKYTIEEVKKYFEDYNCKLLETEYKNNKTLMKYRCDCGNSDCKISFKHFKEGQRCKECMKEKIAEKQRFTIKEVRKIFKDGGCELLETEYKNNYTKMPYICECKELNYITLAGFQEGHRCKKCAIEKVSGKNNYNWNPNLTDEERLIKRGYKEYNKWRTLVYKRDNYTCKCCGEEGGKLNAHHIKNYSSNEELRTVVSNGITLCKKHHKEFHKIYGKKNNNLFQFNEFLKR